MPPGSTRVITPLPAPSAEIPSRRTASAASAAVELGRERCGHGLEPLGAERMPLRPIAPHAQPGGEHRHHHPGDGERERVGDVGDRLGREGAGGRDEGDEDDDQRDDRREQPRAQSARPRRERHREDERDEAGTPGERRVGQEAGCRRDGDGRQGDPVAARRVSCLGQRGTGPRVWWDLVARTLAARARARYGLGAIRGGCKAREMAAHVALRARDMSDGQPAGLPLSFPVPAHPPGDSSKAGPHLSWPGLRLCPRLAARRARRDEAMGLQRPCDA